MILTKIQFLTGAVIDNQHTLCYNQTPIIDTTGTQINIRISSSCVLKVSGSGY